MPLARVVAGRRSRRKAWGGPSRRMGPALGAAKGFDYPTYSGSTKLINKLVLFSISYEFNFLYGLDAL
ncbi:protein of unknown function [Candidatus Methylocalor cossyra]|uniref:Uncharacterized protein n=1 Tax=Candidatus Methylocalor cossyra TaxID=3108543 RepID=A0ABP1C4T3_9GAMM